MLGQQGEESPANMEMIKVHVIRHMITQDSIITNMIKGKVSERKLEVFEEA